MLLLIFLFIGFYAYLIFYKYYNNSYKRLSLFFFTSALVGVNCLALIKPNLFSFEFFLFCSLLLLLLSSFILWEKEFKQFMLAFKNNNFFMQQFIFLALSIFFLWTFGFTQLTLWLVFFGFIFGSIFVVVFQQLMTKIFKQPMVVYSILVILLYTNFLPIHLVCIVFIFLNLRSFLKKIGEKNWFLLQVEEDARTHQMHLESHFKFFVFLKKRALDLSFFLTFLMLLQNSIFFGYLSLSNALLITNISGVLKPVIFFIYAVLFIIHLIILTACNKGQGLDMFQTFCATLFVGSIASFTGYFGFNTVNNPTTHTGDINTTYSLFGHGPLRPTIDEHSAASVASSQAHYVNSLPFLHCAEDRTACHEFVNIMYEKPPTFIDPSTGLERVDHRQMLKLLDLKRNYEAGYKLYFQHQTAVYQTTGLESDRPTLNKLSNSELSTLHTEKPLRRMHSGALQFGCSMDWEQELENLNSIEKNWDRNFMLSSCTRDEVLTRRNTCTDKYLSELMFARVSPSVTPVMQVKMDAKIQALLNSQQR